MKDIVKMTAPAAKPNLYERFIAKENPNGLASDYQWIEPQEIEPRAFLYGRSYIEKFVSCTVAPGGVGKSSLAIAEALAMVTGRPLLGEYVHRPMRVWYWGLEDPLEELQRRVAATAMHFGLTREDICPSDEEARSRLYLDSGRYTPLIGTIQAAGVLSINEDFFRQIERRIYAEDIDVLIIDPYISSHSAPENDNQMQDALVKRWGELAGECSCAVQLIHHTRKSNGEEAVAESARGAKALIDAVRDARVINRMTEIEAENAGVEDHRRYFRVQSDKANLAPPEKARWFQMASVCLGNSGVTADDEYPRDDDWVGVATPWSWPDAFGGLTDRDLLRVQRAVSEGDYRKDQRSPDWVGHPIANVLGLEIDENKGRISELIRGWIKSGALKTKIAPVGNRKNKEFIVVGEWVNE